MMIANAATKFDYAGNYMGEGNKEKISERLRSLVDWTRQLRKQGG
jgi:hypothetical protein